MIQPQFNPAYAQQAPSSGASAVNIQIYEPKAFGSTPNQAAAPMTSPMAAPMPQNLDNQLYNYPQAPMYAPGMASPYQQYAQTPMMPQMYNPYAPMPQAMAPEPQIMPASTMAPEQTAQPAEAPQVEPAAAPASTVDVAKITQELNSPDLNQQTDAITKVAQMSQAEPAIALQLVDNQIMQNLAGIIQKDTAALAGPTKEQVAATEKLQKGGKLTPAEQQLVEQGSPKEMAEKNKVFSMFTLAMLQKLQRDEVKQFNAQAGQNSVPPLKLQDMAGFSEITNTIKTNAIPAVKVAGIQALSYVAEPEDLQVMQQILSPLANDSDADVKQAAQEALTKLSTPQAAPEAAAAQPAAEQPAAAQPAQPAAEQPAQPQTEPVAKEQMKTTQG